MPRSGADCSITGTAHLPSAVKPPPRPPCSVTELYTVIGTFSILLSTCISTLLHSSAHARSTSSARHLSVHQIPGHVNMHRTMCIGRAVNAW